MKEVTGSFQHVNDFSGSTKCSELFFLAEKLLVSQEGLSAIESVT
jgi:hypothetical protein